MSVLNAVQIVESFWADVVCEFQTRVAGLEFETVELSERRRDSRCLAVACSRPQSRLPWTSSRSAGFRNAWNGRIGARRRSSICRWKAEPGSVISGPVVERSLARHRVSRFSSLMSGPRAMPADDLLDQFLPQTVASLDRSAVTYGSKSLQKSHRSAVQVLSPIAAHPHPCRAADPQSLHFGED
jgi:hypothetical protein